MGKEVAGLALLVAATGWSQSFEVASIRQAQEGGRRGPFESVQVTPLNLTMRAVRFRTAVAWAYGVRDFQVSGPDWIDQAGFDIAAKSAGEVKEKELRLMLRTLLADRFKLEIHHERKEQQAWVLTIGKNGLNPNIKESAIEGDPVIQPNLSKGEVIVKGAPVGQLVELLARVLRGPVVNETGLDGKYDATVNLLKYMPDGTGAPNLEALAIRAIQAEFGLKIENRKTMMDLVVVDRAEKTPLEN
jgi:uncharacterized protein (TIGR03435 family)